MSGKKKFLVILVLSFLVFCGCGPNVVGVDSAAYSSGKLYAASSRDVTSVYNATVRALGELEIPVTEKAKDVFSAKVKGRSADGKLITVIIKPVEGGRSDYSIKVGAFGNRSRSEVIYNKIQQNLGILVK